MSVDQINRVVFIAGGVGINPLISILSYLMLSSSAPRTICFFYSLRRSSKFNRGSILFFDRLEKIFALPHPAGHRVASTERELNLYITGHKPINEASPSMVGKMYAHDSTLRTYERRFEHGEMVSSLGPEYERGSTVAYVCGPPAMTDEVVDVLQKAEGMKKENVLYEKWW